MMNDPICGYSVWISTNCRDWYPLYKFVSMTEAQRRANDWRRSGGFAEIRCNLSLVW